MRDPARIDEILDRLKVIWKTYPDLRLTQLIMNVGNPGYPSELYNREDEALILDLEKLYFGQN